MFQAGSIEIPEDSELNLKLYLSSLDSAQCLQCAFAVGIAKFLVEVSLLFMSDVC